MKPKKQRFNVDNDVLFVGGGAWSSFYDRLTDTTMSCLKWGYGALALSFIFYGIYWLAVNVTLSVVIARIVTTLVSFALIVLVIRMRGDLHLKKNKDDSN